MFFFQLYIGVCEHRDLSGTNFDWVFLLFFTMKLLDVYLTLLSKLDYGRIFPVSKLHRFDRSKTLENIEVH